MRVRYLGDAVWVWPMVKVTMCVGFDSDSVLWLGRDADDDWVVSPTYFPSNYRVVLERDFCDAM